MGAMLCWDMGMDLDLAEAQSVSGMLFGLEIAQLV